MSVSRRSIKVRKFELSPRGESSFHHVPVKQPLGDRALKFNTGLILFKLHGEKWLLFFLSPEVARANMMKFPSSPPGVHISGSCCAHKYRIMRFSCTNFGKTVEKLRYKSEKFKMIPDLYAFFIHQPTIAVFFTSNPICQTFNSFLHTFLSMKNLTGFFSFPILVFQLLIWIL